MKKIEIIGNRKIHFQTFEPTDLNLFLKVSFILIGWNFESFKLGWHQNATPQKCWLNVRTHPKESEDLDTLFLKIHQATAEYSDFAAKNTKIENRLVLVFFISVPVRTMLLISISVLSYSMFIQKYYTTLFQIYIYSEYLFIVDFDGLPVFVNQSKRL